MFKMFSKSKDKLGDKGNRLHKKSRPIPSLSDSSEIETGDEKTVASFSLQPLKEETKEDLADVSQEQYETRQAFKSEAKRFIEISKYFSSPLRKTASYVCENCLVSYPNPYRIEYKRGSITTQYVKFCNLTLEPVFIKLYKVIPDLEQIKFINMSLSRCKRVPPGLSYNLGVAYDDVEEKTPCNASMIFVASRKTTTPCYQICEIELLIEARKIRLVTV